MQQDYKFNFYVSTIGDDRWTGQLSEPNENHTDGPFATLEKAKVAVRALRLKEPNGNIQVALRGGTHRLEKTVIFSQQDSSGQQGATTYTAFPGETAIISSGVPIRDWKRLEDFPKGAAAGAAKHLWSADAPSQLTNVLTLYDGLNPLPRSRGRGFTPPRGWKDDAAGRGPCNLFYFPKGIVDAYTDFHGAELLVMPTANYEMNVLPIAYVDRKRLLGVTQLYASRPMGPMQFHSETMWIENRLEDLDEPGEWIFDAENRRLILWPKSGTPSENIVAPRLTELVRIEGDIDYAAPRDEPTRNLNFRGLTFAHAERLPRSGQDGWDLQHSWEMFDSPSALLRLRAQRAASSTAVDLWPAVGAACEWTSIVSAIESETANLRNWVAWEFYWRAMARARRTSIERTKSSTIGFTTSANCIGRLRLYLPGRAGETRLPITSFTTRLTRASS